MDLNRAGLLVGVLALVLAVPLAVLANVLTPKVQSWYSTTSLNRVNKRLMQLTLRLKLSEELWTFTPAEWELYGEGYRRLRATIFGIVGLFYFIAYCFETADGIRHFLGGPIVKIKFLPLNERIAIDGLLLGAAILLSLCAIDLLVANQRWMRHFYLHTNQGRQELLTEIERLTKIKSLYES
jgi:hypothetical protein